MQAESDHLSAIEPFIEEGWITHVLFEVKGGKEATVFCCEGSVRSEFPLVAAKVYTLLSRDIDNVCRWAHKHGVNRPAGKIISGLWRRFVHGELG